MKDPQFNFFEAKPECDQVKFLVTLLDERKCWMTASQIVAVLQGTWTDRDVRMYAEAAKGRIISGQKGYRHIRHATQEEVQHASAWMLSQGKKMIQRAIRIRNLAHQMVGALLVCAISCVLVGCRVEDPNDGVSFAGPTFTVDSITRVEVTHMEVDSHQYLLFRVSGENCAVIHSASCGCHTPEK